MWRFRFKDDPKRRITVTAPRARERLAHYKCPTWVDFAESLPRNPSGKLLKRELREPYWKGRERRIS